MQYSNANNKERVDQFFKDFFMVDQEELARLPPDVQNFVMGWRTYYVKLDQGAVAGGHFHRLKKEILTTIEGEFLVKFEDVYGNKKEQPLDKYTGVITLPFISHEIVGKASHSILKVMANMAHDPNDKQTHDTWVSYGTGQFFDKIKKLYL